MPNPFAHVELNTDDLKKAKKFYQALFAWKLSDVPNMGYTMIDVAGGVGGGMQKKAMPEAPNAWLPYVMVDDVKATVAKAAKLGAQILLEFQEIGDMGSIGVFADPSGAPIGVWAAKPNAAPPAEAPAKKVAKKAPAKKAEAKKAPAPAPAKKAPAKKAEAPEPKKAEAKPAKAKAAPAPAKKAEAKKAPAKAAAPASKPAAAKKPAKKG